MNNARTVEVTDMKRVVQEYSLQKKSIYFKEIHDLLYWFLPELKNAPIKLHYCAYICHVSQLSMLNIQRPHYSKSILSDWSCSGVSWIIHVLRIQLSWF